MFRPGQCATCISPTSGVGLQLSKGLHKGRLLFIGPHNAYHGDVVVRSDDGGQSYKCTMDLHKPGMVRTALPALRPHY